jgi:hypothetical protein
MGVGMKAGYKNLVETGLRRATMEGQCVRDHAKYVGERGWAYCPWCGMELVYKKHCDHCGRDYVSEEAYHVHLSQIEFYKSNPCPNEETVKGQHAVRYHKNRGVFYCPACNIEYPKKMEEGDYPIVDMRTTRSGRKPKGVTNAN